MNDQLLRTALIDAVWRTADRLPYVRSATLAGSFSTGAGLEGIADVDTILIVDSLDQSRFDELQSAFRAELEPILADRLYQLRINPTLGPLKFNDPRTAVLHLMIYTAEGHREHAVKSPFTCLDWQRSPLWRKAKLASVYPIFGLQPHHFISARRGARDYLRDLAENVVTYRRLDFPRGRLQETVYKKPMTTRDRHEFAFHVMRFLMQNFLKLVNRTNEVKDGEPLLTAYFARFSQGDDAFRPLYRELARRKRACDFEPPVADLFVRVADFVTVFEEQFRHEFERHAVRHIVFRHAPTELNEPTGDATVFQGRLDPELPIVEPNKLWEMFQPLAEALLEAPPSRVYTSPLRRAIDSLALLQTYVPRLPAPKIDGQLIEIGYGDCEWLTVAEARERYPDLFTALARGEDRRFPGGGENTADVWKRMGSFTQNRWRSVRPSSLVCTHNVVLRCLVGHLLNVPQTEWYRLRIPHLAPITVISTKNFGLFLDLAEPVEREIFNPFFAQ